MRLECEIGTRPGSAQMQIQSAFRGRAQHVSNLVHGASLIGDFLAVFIALSLAAVVSEPNSLRFPEIAASLLRESATLLSAQAASLIGLFVSRHVYDRHLHLAERESGSEAMCKAIGLWTALWMTLNGIFPAYLSLSPPILACIPFLAALLPLWRTALHAIVDRPSIAVYLRRKILFLGWNQAAAEIASRLCNTPIHPFEISGFVLPENNSLPKPTPKALRKLGTFSPSPDTWDLPARIRSLRIDHVVLADPTLPSQSVSALARLCENELADLTIIPPFFSTFRSGLRITTIEGIPLLSLSTLPLDFLLNRILKRVVDILGAIVGIALSVPLILVFGFLVYRESPGPIFYKQRRIGLKGRIFNLIKIRSMRLDAEMGGKVGWSTQNDPRRLKIGSFIRRFNIDEVPQFWNVLKGEMSLVGPRPERPELTSKFDERIEDYNVRHGVKPGITGLAQIKGLRGDTDIAERIRQDLIYIEQWNLWSDLAIMFRTLVNNKNAC